MSRTNGVVVTNPEVQHHLMNALKVDTFPELVMMQARNALLAFNSFGETSGQFGHPAPILDWYTGVFAVLGMAILLTRIFRSRYTLIGSWFWLTFVSGGILTVDALFTPRVTLMIPTVFVVAALAIDASWRALGRIAGRVGWAIGGGGVAALLVLAARDNYE